MIIVVCPGQGSQTPGFLVPWLGEKRFQEHLEALSETAKIDLIRHGTLSDAATIRDTRIAQPLIVAAGLLTLRALSAEGRDALITGIAGHSVGEITAATGAGIFSESEAIAFVCERANAMAEAAENNKTSMSAVIGAEETELLARCAELGLEPANFNGGSQIVVAGEISALETLSATPPKGSRVIPLSVAGAFHTRFMSPAVVRLRAAAKKITPANPRLTIWTNHDGQIVSSGSEFLDLLVNQVSSPVRWDKCMASFQESGVKGIIEVSPAGALTGLAKRALREIPTVALKTPEDLPQAIELLTSSV